MICRRVSKHGSMPMQRQQQSAAAIIKPQRHTTQAASRHHETQTAPSKVHSLVSSTALSLALLVAGAPVQAAGIESVDLPNLPDMGVSRDGAVLQQEKIKQADDTFAQSDTLKRLLEQSEANKAKNKKAIADKYCYRQAELGVGDCGGLRYIPGMTESGKQQTPDWLSDLLGVERAKPDPNAITLKDLFGGEVPK